MPGDPAPIVIDPGSGLFKCGFGGHSSPSVVLPTVIGTNSKLVRTTSGILCSSGSAHYGGLDPSTEPSFLVGTEAHAIRSVVDMTFPVKKGIIVDFAAMEKMWHYVFGPRHLAVNPTEHPVLLTETPLNPTLKREVSAEILFETFGIPAMYFEMQPVLALHASGRPTGVVLGCGDETSHAVPIFEGHPVIHVIHRMQYGGRDVTHYLERVLTENFLHFESCAVHGLKERGCYVARDYHEELYRWEESPGMEEPVYELPDGVEVKLGALAFRAPEMLFRPSFIGLEELGLCEAVHKSIVKCDRFKEDFYANVVLYGGSTMFRGLPLQLKEGVDMLLPRATHIQVDAPENRNVSAWLGGAMLSTLATMKAMWISRASYGENGPSLFQREFPTRIHLSEDENYVRELKVDEDDPEWGGVAPHNGAQVSGACVEELVAFTHQPEYRLRMEKVRLLRSELTRESRAPLQYSIEYGGIDFRRFRRLLMPKDLF